MRTDTQVSKQDCLVFHYPAVDEIIGIPSSTVTSIINDLGIGETSEIIREFNIPESTATKVKKGKKAIRHRAYAIYLKDIPAELRNSLFEGIILYYEYHIGWG